MMAKGVKFEGSNVELKPPIGLVANRMGHVENIPAHNDGTQIITCWRLSDEEMQEVMRTGVVWLSVAGQSMNTLRISGEALVRVAGRPSVAEPYVHPLLKKMDS